MNTKKMHRQIWRLGCILLMFVFLACPNTAFSLGMGVDPGEIDVRNVPLGKVVAVSTLGGEGMKLVIENKSDSAYTYTINILSTSETNAPLKQDYVDIPDVSWVWPENKEVRIAGNSKQSIDLFLKIPEKEEYYNKKYQAVIEVKSKKNDAQEIFVLACQMKILFSTVVEE